MCDRISLPRTVSDSAKQLFKRQDEEHVFRSKAGTTTSKQQAAIVAACIFIACRDQKVGRTFKEIVSLSGVPKKEIGQAFSRLSQAFGTSTAASSTSSHASSAAGIVSRFGNHLGLPPAVQSATTEVVRNIDEFGILAGRSPLSVAAACVYFTCHAFGVPKTVKEIGAVVGISDSTLRTVYK
jgi:transcription initiation factor TFIIB